MPNFMCSIKCTYPTAPKKETILDDGVFSLSSQTEASKWINALKTILLQPHIQSSFILHALDPISPRGINSIEHFSAELHQRIAKHIGLEFSVNLTTGIDQLPLPQTIKVILIDSASASHEISFTPSQWRKFHTFCNQLLENQRKLEQLELSNDPFKSLSLHVKTRRKPRHQGDGAEATITTYKNPSDDDLSSTEIHRRQRVGATATRATAQGETPTADILSRRERQGEPPSPPVNRVLDYVDADVDDGLPTIGARKRTHVHRKPIPLLEEQHPASTQRETQEAQSHAPAPCETPQKQVRQRSNSGEVTTKDGSEEKPSKKIVLDAATAAAFVGGFLCVGAGAWLLFNASSAAAAIGASTALSSLMLANPAIPTLIGLACLLVLTATTIILARQPRVKACSKRLFQSCKTKKTDNRALFDNSL